MNRKRTLSNLSSGSSVAAITALALCAGAAVAADNYFLPHGMNNWNVSGNWSLGHCPQQTEHVYIAATTTTPKIVTYNWTGISNYGSVKVDGNGGVYYGAIYQPDLSLTTTTLYMSTAGDSYYTLEGPAHLWVDDNMYTGYSGTHDAFFELDTAASWAAGLYVGDLCYVGYGAPAEFLHRRGFAEIGRLYIGQNDPGTYTLQGTTAGSILRINGQFVLGNGKVGVFEQTGGKVEQIGTNGLIMGLNTGGEGTYNMRGGELHIDHLSLGWNGDAYFNQTNGDIYVTDDVNLGCDGTHPHGAWLKIEDVDGDPSLTIGDDLLIGVQSYARYEQNGGGTVTVNDRIEIWDGDPDPANSSYLYMDIDADWLSAATLINTSGYLDQDGGTLSVTNLTNNSTQGVNLDNEADCRARYLTNNAGIFQMYRNALLRGTYAGGGNYWLCNFTNNATFRMGTAAVNGGTFRGILTNNGTFNFYRGDCSESKIINEGTVNLYGDLDCQQFVNNNNFTVPSDRWVTGSGVNAPNAFENNGTLTLKQRGHVDVGNNSTFVNNGPMYAGGPGGDYAHIYGDVINNAYLLPCDSALAAGQLYINGDFTATSSAELRIRISGPNYLQHDYLAVQGHAQLGGELDVRLTNGFVPQLGDSFDLVGYSTRSGTFNPVYLPALNPGLIWELAYNAGNVRITVVEDGGDPCPEDLNGDGVVNQSDLGELLGDYGQGPGGDIDGDGDTDQADLGALLAMYGQSCP